MEAGNTAPRYSPSSSLPSCSMQSALAYPVSGPAEESFTQVGRSRAVVVSLIAMMSSSRRLPSSPMREKSAAACGSSGGADVLDEPGDLGGGDHPHLVRVDSMVVVREHDPQADDVAPGNAGMLRAEVLAEGVRRLADDLQETLHREPPDPVLVPGVPAKLGDLGDFAGGIQDVGDALVVPAAHRSTDSARIARSRLFSPPAETTSTGRPSSASSSRDMRIRSNRELPWSKSTSRSMSLSGLSSPRAAEPKRRTLLA